MPLDLGRQLVVRWPDPDPSHLPLLRKVGIEAALLDKPAAAFEHAASGVGIIVAAATEAGQAIRGGLWPGVRDQPRRERDDEVASASREPWVDQNGHLYAMERALKPGTVPVGGTLPPADRMVPFETLELALIEARVNGGNFVLALDTRYREQLLNTGAKALAAWESLGKTAAWLKHNSALFGRPALPFITAAVEPGLASAEIAKLLYRRNASPALVSAANVASAGAMTALTAAGLKSVPEAAYAHARRGATVVVDARPDPSWKLTRKDADRDFYSLGRGQVVAYHKRIADPSEFALDVIDLVGHRSRAARLWNAPAAVLLATSGGLLHIINYGSPVEELQARVQGHFTRATLLRPDAAPQPLKIFRRGSTTEVFLPVTRLAVVRFE